MAESTKEVREPLNELRDLVSATDGNGSAPKKTDRRNMLKLAGAAVLGAAGAAAVRVVPASAASGGNMIIGCSNLESSATLLSNSTAGQIAFNAFAPTTGLQGVGTGGSAETGVIGVSKSGTGKGVAGSATSGVGVGGQATTGIGVEGMATTGTAVVGQSSTSGTGTQGNSSSGVGVLGFSGTGYDVQLGFPVLGGAVGSGRLAMIGRFDSNNTAPNFAPAFTVTSTGTYSFEHELVRGSQATIWASRYAAGGTNQSRWKRINTVRTDTSDGTGAFFKPFRRIDTRSGVIKAAGSVTAVSMAGAGTGSSLIPGSAIAVMGNLTAVAYTGGGFLTIMPAGIVIGTAAGNYNPSSDPSSVNFIVGQAAIANSFVCGLNGGSLQVYVGGPPLPGHASHFIIDITAYLE